MQDTLLFMVELVVDGLDIFKISEDCSEQDTCVTLKIPGTGVNLALCDAELGSDSSARAGKTCFFSLSDVRNQVLQAVISVHKKQKNDSLLLIGSHEIDVTQTFISLAEGFAGTHSSRTSLKTESLGENLSTKSILSFRRHSLVTDVSKSPTQQILKGLFPLTVEDSVTATIALLLRVSCFGKSVHVGFEKIKFKN